MPTWPTPSKTWVSWVGFFMSRSECENYLRNYSEAKSDQDLEKEGCAMDLLKRAVSSIRRFLDNDRAVMIVCAVLSLARGSLYLFLPNISDLQGHMALLAEHVPINTYGITWIVAGLVAMISIFFRRFTSATYGIFIALLTLWAIVFLVSWVAGLSTSGYVNATSYGANAVLLYLLARTPNIVNEVNDYIAEEPVTFPNDGEVEQ